ncbi:uncharacterized protein LOC142169835 [Nicotiana tabacum]|uniref:Uncharacterized protein LOC142169835 n=1 Tax=Nicotiana tabacum TaxID=4097 RepID=A0AC58SSA1_TOBAC
MMKKLMADQQDHTAEMIKKVMVDQEMIKKVMVDQQAQAATMRNLERQMGQLASTQNTRPVGVLPSDTEANPKPTTIESESEKPRESEKPAEEAVDEKPPPLVARPPLPFPQRFQNMKDNATYKTFLDILKQVQINILLVDILQEVSKYAKCIKYIVANKRRLTEFETVALTEECSSRIQIKIPQKLKDPGSFTIQISIGKHAVERALCDLGASINLMPLSVSRQLGLGEPRPTTVILQLVDRSLAHPEGVIEDVLVQVGSFIFPIDFIILDYEPDQEVPFILRRPFLATCRAIIDVCEGKMTMRVVESNAMPLVPYMSPTDPLERALIGNEEDIKDKMMGEIEQVLDTSCNYVYGFGKLEELDKHIVIFLEDQEKTTFTCPYGIFAFKRMPFGLCNAPTTFQRCIMTIFTDMVEIFVEVFMDNFSVFGSSYDDYLKNLSKVFPRCEETNMVLNWEKISFYGAGRHRVGLSEKDVTFNFDDACLKAFEELKKKLVVAPIIAAPDWSLPFELMCDASDHTIGAMLGQRKDKIFYSIYYASKTLDDAQLNYTTTEKYLFTKKESKARLMRWVLLLKEFDVEIRYRKGIENQVTDHLSRLEKHNHVEEGDQIKEVFPDEQLFAITQDPPPWYANYVNYQVSRVLPHEIES